MVVIPYFPLSDDVMGGIVMLQLERVARTVRGNQGANFVYDDVLVDHVVSRCNDPGSGGRMIDRIITNSILPTISREFLERQLRDEVIDEVRVSARDGELLYAFNGAPFPDPPEPPAETDTPPTADNKETGVAAETEEAPQP